MEFERNIIIYFNYWDFQTMKAIIFLTALLSSLEANNWNYKETGLCIEQPIDCSKRKQKYGVCCVDDGTEYLNFCLACMNVSINVT